MTDQKFENLKPINADAVATLAGKAVFHRGEAYYHDGRGRTTMARQVLTELDTEQSLELIDYALLRINRALETIDDSGGFRMHSVSELGELHIQILADSGWSPEKLTACLHKLYTAGEVELYPEIPDDYMPLLGLEGLALFMVAKGTLCRAQ